MQVLTREQKVQTEIRIAIGELEAMKNQIAGGMVPCENFKRKWNRLTNIVKSVRVYPSYPKECKRHVYGQYGCVHCGVARP